MLKSDGAGATSFVNPTTLTNVNSTIITNSSATAILPSVVDVPVTATFDSTIADTNLSLNATGVITVLTDGFYEFTFNFNFGRANSTGIAYIVARLLVNGTPTGFVQGASLSTNVNSRPTQANLSLNLSATDTVYVQVMRDSTGTNDGGLYPIAVTNAGWGDVPSYWVRAIKRDGMI